MNKKRKDKLQDIIDELAELFEFKDVAKWFDTPNKILDGESPKEFLKQPDGLDKLLELLRRVGS